MNWVSKKHIAASFMQTPLGVRLDTRVPSVRQDWPENLQLLGRQADVLAKHCRFQRSTTF